jgi:TetR/AcrR family transcriptional regulator
MHAPRRAPEQTREQILQAATEEFADKGYEGARIDQIASRAGANKRMLYHYYGNKRALFEAVLERTYADIRRAEAALELEQLTPTAGMRRLVEFSFDYYRTNPHFIRLLNSENLYGARHLKALAHIRDLNSPLIRMITDLLRRGQVEGAFRADVDPVQLYISIAGLGYFYFSNIHTLSAIFGEDLTAAAPRRRRRDHVADVILAYLRP